ncbi:ABC transporter ATP-binding protein [Nesterenkonia sp. HG001]|uniref:ABC transporter ATP-binding protein n=1 Tax=Nesterenkonia sp. HG001 TaxID=2983207 RepID=UPI002AC6A25B|nr:ABC transporter ATP-binding protein [Nesterenkonia sp. HG001]MDZ5078695.1 ABC transporter ATP-binding protein [Nesterenkonia sp. HG001]
MSTATDTPARQTASAGAATATSENEVVLEDVTKRFGRTTVLESLNLRLAPGELISVLGPSGCGKTTALRILAGFERPTAGRVLVAGQDVTAMPPNRRDIGMVFQSYSLFPNLSVRQNVEYGLRVRRVRAEARRRAAEELLEMCGLGSLGERYPHQLSGGQQQRVALARALAVQPSVLLLDEPLSALDAIVRTQIREEIRRLQQQLGITTMFVTHDQEEALAIADRVAVLNGGVIEQIDVPQAVYQRPASEFVARFVGTVTTLGAEASFTRGALPARPPGPGLDTVFIRPEDLTLVPAEDGGCTVVSQIYTGERTVVRAESAEGPTVTTSVSSAEAADLVPGTRVTPHVLAAPALRLPAGAAQRVSP